MAIKVIVELKAKPGQRDALISLIEHIMTDGPPMPGSLGATFYKSVDDPDMLVEIADWESAEARAAVMTAAESSGAFTPMFELLAAPFRATIVEALQ
ncbi:MAG: antibiotic biosynthesis monooxygenase [Actinobacteria bacterium]|nr:antibiotic biosynthesis monooxygenase [Actinomycetota bacterium]